MARTSVRIQPSVRSIAHGTADDPRIVLIGVAIHAAVFLEVEKPKPVVRFELAKGWLTGKRVDAGEAHQLTEPHRP